jgi:hypothetical protein
LRSFSAASRCCRHESTMEPTRSVEESTRSLEQLRQPHTPVLREGTSNPVDGTAHKLRATPLWACDRGKCVPSTWHRHSRPWGGSATGHPAGAALPKPVRHQAVPGGRSYGAVSLCARAAGSPDRRRRSR